MAPAWTPLPLRIVLGLVFVVHGGQKLFVSGIPGVASGLADMGIQPAMLWATVVTVVELFGGIAVLIGFLTRWAALLLAIDMAVATAVVHLPRGFFVGDGGYEFVLTLLGVSIALVLSGPGPLAVDRPRGAGAPDGGG